MAVFPTSPSVGTTTIINGMTYAYNSQGAWEIAHTQSDESLVDVGVSTFVNESSSPSAIAGKALLYAKDVSSGGTGLGDACFHFEDNVNDSSTNGNNGTANDITYVASGAGASETGFGKAGVFDGTSQTVGGDSYFTFPRVEIGTGDYTISFWLNVDSVADGQFNCILSSGANGDGAFRIIIGSWNSYFDSKELRIYHNDNGSWQSIESATPIGNLGFTNNTWFHFAFVRSGTSHAWYFGEAGESTGDRNLNQTITAYGMSDTGAAGSDMVVGRLHDGTSGYELSSLCGKLDELIIAKEVLPPYVGLGATYTIPDAPHSAPGGISKLHVMDSTGSEGVIS